MSELRLKAGEERDLDYDDLPEEKEPSLPEKASRKEESSHREFEDYDDPVSHVPKREEEEKAAAANEFEDYDEPIHHVHT